MKTWLEYINEEAKAVGLEVHRLEWSSGAFACYRVYRLWRLFVELPARAEGLPRGDFETRAEVEAFVLGVVFGRTGKVGA